MSSPERHGRVLQVNVSPGGVPKLPVAAARVDRYGLEGDTHREPTVHGGPHRAVAIFAIEAIRRVAAEGHPIAPGTAGENLTTEGIEIAALPIGTRLAIGEDLVLEVSSPVNPCETIRGSFSDGRFARISIVTHPLDTRMYARVVTPGVVRAGDRIDVLGPASDSRASELAALARLDAAHRASSLAIWRAAIDSGIDLRVVDDNEIALCARPGVRGGMWNLGLGFAGLPNLAAMGVEHFRAHGADGWLELDPTDPEATDLRPTELGATELPEEHLFVATRPAEVHPAPAIDGLTIKQIGPADGTAWARLLASAGGLPDLDVAAWAALAPRLAAHAHATLFVAEIGGRAVGTAMLHTHRKVGWLPAAAVVDGARGLGIHRALVAERARLAADVGCDLVGADVVPDAVSAANLRSMGFREIGRRRRYPARMFEETAATRAATGPATRAATGPATRAATGAVSQP